MDHSRWSMRYPVAAFVLLSLAACSKAPESESAARPAPTVSVADVIEQPVIEWDEVTGRL